MGRITEVNTAIFYDPYNQHGNNEFLYRHFNIQWVKTVEELICNVMPFRYYYLWEQHLKVNPNFIETLPDYIKSDQIKVFLDMSTGEIPISAYQTLATQIKEFGEKYFVINLNSQYEFEEFNKLFPMEKPLIFLSNRNELHFFENVLTSQRPKKFLFLSRRFTPTRLLIFLDLHKRNIIQNSRYTFSIFKQVYGTPNYEKFTCEELVEIWNNKFSSIESDYVTELGNYFFSNIQNIYGELDKFVGSTFANQNPYEIANMFNESYISLLVESKINGDSNTYQPSEKLMKCYYYKHPFLVYSTHNFLAHTRKSGYKTFNLFDERYDGIPDYIERIKTINDQVEYLNTIETHKFTEIYNDSLPIVNHNHNLLVSKMNSPYNYFEYNKANTNLAQTFQGKMIFSNLR